jgi:hypothetical protein
MNVKNQCFGYLAGAMQILGARHGAVTVQGNAQSESPGTKAPGCKTNYGIRFSGWVYLALALLFMFPGVKSFAQYENGSLVGTNHDATGAAVPGVTVTVTNTATGGSGGSTVSGTDNNTSAPTSLAGGTITGTWEPRIVQFGLKVIF